MKLIHSNGTILEVWDLGPVVFRLRAGSVPLKYNSYSILTDDAVRTILRDLLATGLYDRVPT